MYDMMLGDDPTDLIVCQMETLQDDAISINRRAAEMAELVHSVIDIPYSPFGKPPHGESTRKIHFSIPDAFAKSISKEDYRKYYEPRVVSIGPFHHGKDHVASMEYFKMQAVRELEERVKVSIEKAYARVERDLLRIAKECYDDVSRCQGISDRDWCRMMFLDGCFIIEFISKYDITTSDRKSWLSIMKKHDRELVFPDLLLLENQLPFQVLLKLAGAFGCLRFAFEVLPIKLLQMPLPMISSARLASGVTDYDEASDLDFLLRQWEDPDPIHLLQYYRNIWVRVLSVDDVEEEKEEEEEDHLAVCRPFSVTELKKVGIRCTRDSNTVFSPGNIHFKSSILSGHVFLPQLTIDEWTVTLFSNLLAYGDSCSMLRESSGFSSYLNFMGMLINGEEDVKELRARGILNVNFKIDDDTLFNFLRDITAYTESNHKDIKKVRKQISNYFESKCIPLRIGYAELKQRYFSGPWSFLVFLAVIFTVSMTVIQIVFTGIQTYK